MLQRFVCNVLRDADPIKVTLTALLSFFGGGLVKFLGGFDTMLITLVTMIVIDYVSGVIRAIYQKKLSSSIGYKGILKKALCMMIVGLSVSLQNILPEAIPLREVTILFFVTNEGFSILENAAGIIPLPRKLRDVLLQLREENEKEDNSQNSEDESEQI